MVLKSTIHQLIDACEDDSRLEAVQAILKEGNEEDWWQLLPDFQKDKTLASLQQADEGNTIAHPQLMEKLWTKFTK